MFFSFFKRKIVRLLCFFILIGASVGICFAYYLYSPGRHGECDQVFYVNEGETLREVTDALEKKELIFQKTIFLVYARAMGYGHKIKTGEYRLNAGMSPLMILDILSRGAIVTHPVTIPEGFTREQIGRLLKEKGLIDEDEFMGLTGASALAKSYGLSSPNLEGFLYPDTYHLSRGLSTKSVIDVLVKRFLEVVSPFREKIEKSGMTLEQVITLASIVEKETGAAEERPLIASVFLNRLKQGKRLESDPTVIYGIKNFNGNLTKKDLSTLTPYNTYRIKGLPPGAIANPGEDAVKAVLYPAVTKYFYFVSKNDGTHHFSETLFEHNRAVRIYQKNRKSRLRAAEKNNYPN